MPAEKMLIDMLSFLSTKPEGPGFNEIARYLAGKGYTPLYSGSQGKESEKPLLHPNTLKSLLKNALDEELITSDHPLGESPRGKRNTPRGKRNRFHLTKKGRMRLKKGETIRFIEDSDPKPVKIPSEFLEKPFHEAERQLDIAAVDFSKPLGPGDRLNGPEDMFFVEKNVEAMARTLLFGSKINVFVPRGFASLSLTKDQIKQLCFLLVAYGGGQRAFYIVLSYDPRLSDIEMNPSLRSDIADLEFDYFRKWLSKFRNDNVDPNRLESLLAVALLGHQQDQHPESGFAKEEVERYKRLWVEFDGKRERVDKVMAEIRSYQIEFEDWKAAEFTEKHPSAKKE